MGIWIAKATKARERVNQNIALSNMVETREFAQNFWQEGHEDALFSIAAREAKGLEHEMNMDENAEREESTNVEI